MVKPIHPWPNRPHTNSLPPVTPGAPGGEWDPPEGVTDVAVLIPYQDLKAMKSVRKETHLVFFEVKGLDGSYILSSDGSTRPYGEGH
jgi:hypothetical protein